MQSKNKSTRNRWSKLSVIAVLAVAGAFTTVSALTTLDNSVSRVVPYLKKLMVTQQGDQTSASIVELSGNTQIKFPVGNSPIQPSQILQAPTGQFSSTPNLTGGSFYSGSVTTHHILDGSLLLIDFRANLNVLAAASGSCSLGYAAITITGGVIGTNNCVPISTFAWNTLWGTTPCPVWYGMQGFTNTGLIICNAIGMGVLQATYFSDYWRVSSTNANDIYYGTGGASCVSLAVYSAGSAVGGAARCWCDTDPNAIDAACASTGATYTGDIPGGTIPSSLACVDIDTDDNIKIAHTINVVNPVVGGTSTLQYVPSPGTSSALNTSPRCGCDATADGAQECASLYTGADVGSACIDQWVQYPASYIPRGLNGRVMVQNYSNIGSVPTTGSVCTGTGDVGVGLDTPLEKLHVKLQGNPISCSTYTGTIGGGAVSGTYYQYGGITTQPPIYFGGSACSCDTSPTTIDCQVFNQTGTPLSYPLMPNFYYIYLPAPQPNGYCSDEYVVGGNTKYQMWEGPQGAQTIAVNASSYTGLITSCTTGEATFRVDNSWLLFAPGLLIFTGGTATTTGTVVTTWVVTGSLHVSGYAYGYRRTIAGPLNNLANVTACSCDAGTSRDCTVFDSGFNSLQTPPYISPTANRAGGMGIITNGTASGTWAFIDHLTGGAGYPNTYYPGTHWSLYPYSGFNAIQQKIVSSTANNFGSCRDSFTSGGVTWYDEFVNIGNVALPGNQEWDEVVQVKTSPDVGMPACWFDITDANIDYAFRMPWGAPIFPSYPWILNAPSGYFTPQRKGTATYVGPTLTSISWSLNTNPYNGNMSIWIAPKKIGSADCYDKYWDTTAWAYRYIIIKDQLTDGDDYEVDYLPIQTVNKTLTISTGTLSTGTVVNTGTPSSVYWASYVGATTVAFNGPNIMTRTDAHVGFNKEYPATDLHVMGNVRFQSLADTSMTYLGVTSTGVLTTTGTVNILSGGVYTWYVTGDYRAQWPVNGAIYYNTANVGIGTNTPTDKLHVMGDVRANNYYSNSDSGLKINITDMASDDPTAALATLLNLRGKTFNWIGDDSPGMGVIAQEVEDVYPNMVKTDDNDYKSVLYMNLIAPVITSITALNAVIVNHTENLIAAQNAAISALEGRIYTLENPRR